MGSFQQPFLLFLALTFVIAITPAFSVVGWGDRYLPNPRFCWKQINRVHGCQLEIYDSLSQNKIKLSAACCEAIQGLSYKCKIWIFNHGRFTPEFGNRLKSYCAGLGIPLPPSYRIYYPDNTSGQIGD